jgi:hypothetical protein
LLGPCSFEATRITKHSFSFIYLNTPFDDEFGGGGREEVKFLRQAVDLLVPGGLRILVCPANQVFGTYEMCELLDTWFDRIELYLFPDDCRSFSECVVCARRRKTALPNDQIRDNDVLSSRGIRYCSTAPIEQLARLGEPQFSKWNGGWPDTESRKRHLDVWELPFSPGPKRFQKTALTDEELERELACSALYEKLRQRVLSPTKRPPLSLNKGHTSLLLLTGILDGYVPSKPPHVVRGFTSKIEKLTRTESHETASGDSVTKQVFSESPIPIVRAVWPDGIIRTFSEPVGNDDVQIEDDEPELEEEGPRPRMLAPPPTSASPRKSNPPAHMPQSRNPELMRNRRARRSGALTDTTSTVTSVPRPISRWPRPRPRNRSSQTIRLGSERQSTPSTSIQRRRARSDYSPVKPVNGSWWISGLEIRS